MGKFCRERILLREKRNKIYKKIICAIKQKSNRRVELRQSDFTHGTYIIEKPGTYVLMEDIEFAPNPDNNYWPKENSKYSKIPAYHLGFFAAIAIDSDYVCIDLNHHELKSSKKFQYSQRYYANIVTGPSPFIKLQGPGNFGSKIGMPSYLWIKNGTLGLSSHHGIQGNPDSNVIVENVTAKDFEFIGFALNVRKNVIFEKCVAKDNIKHLPVNALWSAALFLQLWCKHIAKKYHQIQSQFDALNNIIDITKQDLFTEDRLINPESIRLFHNPHGCPEVPQLPDGNGYGFVVHPPGVAVHDFDNKIPWEQKTHNAFFDHCVVKNLHYRPDEVVGISQADGTGVQNDTAGAVFRIEMTTDDNNFYVPNVVADLQIAIAALSVRISKINITSEVVQWALSNPAKTLDDMVLSVKDYRYVSAIDTMAHNTKGVIGIRLDAVSNVLIENTIIDDILNAGCLGNEIYNGNYKVCAPKQHRYGYNGMHTYGIHLSDCDHVFIYNTDIGKLVSFNGIACAIRSINGSHECDYHKGKIDNIKAGYKYDNGQWYGYDYYFKLCQYSCNWPNGTPIAIGIDVADVDCKMTHCAVDITDNIQGPLSIKVNQGNTIIE